MNIDLDELDPTIATHTSLTHTFILGLRNCQCPSCRWFRNAIWERGPEAPETEDEEEVTE